MKRAYRFPFICLLLCLVASTACEEKEKPEGGEREGEQADALTLTPEQQETIGLTTAKAVAREVRPELESFGRVIPRLQGRVQVTSPVAGNIFTGASRIDSKSKGSVQIGNNAEG